MFSIFPERANKKGLSELHYPYLVYFRVRIKIPSTWLWYCGNFSSLTTSLWFLKGFEILFIDDEKVCLSFSRSYILKSPVLGESMPRRIFHVRAKIGYSVFPSRKKKEISQTYHKTHKTISSILLRDSIEQRCRHRVSSDFITWNSRSIVAKEIHLNPTFSVKSISSSRPTKKFGSESLW